MSVLGFCAFCDELLDGVNSNCSKHQRQREIAVKLVEIGHDPEITRCGSCGAVVEISGACWSCGDAKPLDYLKHNPDIDLGDEEPGDGTNDDGGLDEEDDEDDGGIGEDDVEEE